MNPYFDEFGLLNDCTPVTPSENRSLWLAELFLHDPADPEVAHTIPALKSCYSAEDDKWWPVPDKVTCSDEFFSRDNMIGVTAVGKFTGDEFLRSAGIKCFNYRYLQPQDVVYFLYCYCPVLGWLGVPFLFLNMLWSMWNIRRCGMGVMDTDGRILTWVRCRGASGSAVWRWWFRILERVSDARVRPWLIANPSEIPPEFEGNIDGVPMWRIIFAKYFRDPMHPINVKCRERYPRVK